MNVIDRRSYEDREVREMLRNIEGIAKDIRRYMHDDPKRDVSSDPGLSTSGPLSVSEFMAELLNELDGNSAGVRQMLEGN